MAEKLEEFLATKQNFSDKKPVCPRLIAFLTHIIAMNNLFVIMIFLIILSLSCNLVFSQESIHTEHYWKGEEHFTNGDRYDGEMSEGNKSGVGTYTWDSGDSYEGQWKNDLMTGTGVFRYADGAVYDGDWVDNERTGYGYYKSAEGNLYIGNWLNGYVDGYGQLTLADGETYEGNFFAFFCGFLKHFVVFICVHAC